MGHQEHCPRRYDVERTCVCGWAVADIGKVPFLTFTEAERLYGVDRVPALLKAARLRPALGGYWVWDEKLIDELADADARSRLRDVVRATMGLRPDGSPEGSPSE